MQSWELKLDTRLSLLTWDERNKMYNTIKKFNEKVFTKLTEYYTQNKDYVEKKKWEILVKALNIIEGTSENISPHDLKPLSSLVSPPDAAPSNFNISREYNKISKWSNQEASMLGKRHYQSLFDFNSEILLEKYQWKIPRDNNI